MAVKLNVHLFGKPGEMIGEVTPEALRALADELHARLDKAAHAVENLTARGWKARVAVHELCLSHPHVTTPMQAERVLHKLGVYAEAVSIEE